MSINENKKNSLKHVPFDSLIGIKSEFFDFYIYANAAVLVFPQFRLHWLLPFSDSLCPDFFYL